MQRTRLAVLVAAVALTASLPLAGALAGPTSEGRTDRTEAARQASSDARKGAADPVPSDPSGSSGEPGRAGASAGAGVEEKAPGRTTGGGLLSGLGLTTAAQCGPELASPDGVEAQTCVLAQEGDTWARTYYRNATGERLRAVLTLMGPGGRTVQMHCAVGADDEPGACETPREPGRGEPAAYTAIAEFAAPQGAEGDEEERPLLLRSGSNSPHTPRS
ncbi:hypothetical protein [Streptomyces cavernicola]|uniref:Serine/threonine protein kinase n=1 Tax=Streptomyces cavernicola TaxID=3043613 RepID=A0ABT6S5I2_9ACTN|nr:hypothetical protein [Streptomyces sp. B-S-A6]MDI3402683.1 hypothetical protein [Streptomyces sp. B-S-A6]